MREHRLARMRQLDADGRGEVDLQAGQFAIPSIPHDVAGVSQYQVGSATVLLCRLFLDILSNFVECLGIEPPALPVYYATADRLIGFFANPE
jgi:hypothetical protein